MIKLLIFDHDMTIVDSCDAIMAGFNAVADVVGRPRVGHDKVMEHIADPLPDFCAGLLGEYRPEWVEMYMEKAALVDSDLIKPFPDTAPTMRALREMGVILAVASNREDPRPAMESSGTAAYFDLLVGARHGTDGRRLAYKPAPDMLLAVMEHFRMPPSVTVYVGDADIDMMTAKAAGVRSVGVPRGGFTAEQLTAAGAWRVIDSTLAELADMVRND